ncbi:MAG: type II secretion system inner membrane protein GspF [Gammaproteobacteria bacterium]|nr:type II secretion system inner membrane protein GspF [Gammaproteobacteria bacterium]
MAAYEYLALTAAGKRKKGGLEADSARQTRQILREQGLVPMEVNETVEKSRGKSPNRKPLFQRGVSVSDMSLLMRQISTLVQSGMPVEESLSAVAQQTEKAHVKNMILAMRAKVLEGHSLATGMAEYPHIFGDLYRATTDAGEHSGHLDIVLERLADYAENRQKVRKQTMGALLYPLILTTFAIIVVVAMMVSVVPMVVETFDNRGAELPALTTAIIAISDFVVENGITMLIILLLGGFSAKVIFARPGPKAWLHRQFLRIPLISKLIRGLNASRFGSTLSILSASGVPVLDAMKVSRQVVTNIPIGESIEAATDRVREGQPINKALQQSGHFPPMMIHLIANGEASGEFDQMLARASNNQEQELESTLSTLMGILGPSVILAMGGFVLLIVLAILLPIFNLNSLVQ